MTESDLILVDTNVLLDVTKQDEQWADWSQEQMNEHVGRMVVNPIIYSELCYEAGDPLDVDTVLLTLGVDFRELPRQALFLAAQAFRLYRQRGGNKTAPLPDFFIGAHAAAMKIPIITRNTGRYRTYFPSVELICP
jgi:predicted nucleic acid-binding protein